jgi:hypothetical protein
MATSSQEVWAMFPQAPLLLNLPALSPPSYTPPPPPHPQPHTPTQVIKELWQRTYRGQDIDCIQIRADADGSARSYNYR